MPFKDSLASSSYDLSPLRDTASGRATPFPGSGNSLLTIGSTNGTTGGSSPHSDADSGFGDETDCTRPINWGSVLSLSSQSALDPLAAVGEEEEVSGAGSQLLLSIGSNSSSGSGGGSTTTTLSSGSSNVSGLCASPSSSFTTLVTSSSSSSGSGNSIVSSGHSFDYALLDMETGFTHIMVGS